MPKGQPQNQATRHTTTTTIYIVNQTVLSNLQFMCCSNVASRTRKHFLIRCLYVLFIFLCTFQWLDLSATSNSFWTCIFVLWIHAMTFDRNWCQYSMFLFRDARFQYIEGWHLSMFLYIYFSTVDLFCITWCSIQLSDFSRMFFFVSILHNKSKIIYRVNQIVLSSLHFLCSKRELGSMLSCCYTTVFRW